MPLCLKRKRGEGIQIPTAPGRSLDIFVLKITPTCVTLLIDGERVDKVYRLEHRNANKAKAFLAEHFPEAVA